MPRRGDEASGAGASDVLRVGSGFHGTYYGGFMSYVDGYVLPVPKKSMAVYRRIAQKAAKIWKRNHWRCR